ncbi:MAG: TIGR00266 family protein [Sarcina sp.]
MAKIEKLNQTGNTGVIKINAEKGDTFIVAEGTFLAMTDTFDVKVQKHKDFKKTLEKAISGHKVVLEEYVAREDGELMLTDDKLGDVLVLELDETKEYILEQKEFIASYGNLEYSVEDGKLSNLFGGEGLFRLRVKGKGIICVSAFGLLLEKELKSEEVFIIDMEHIVLRESNLQYEIVEVENTRKGLIEGEGRAVKVTGPGKVWYQAKTFNAYMNNPEL